MPIFRIMGGQGGRGRSSSNDNNNSANDPPTAPHAAAAAPPPPISSSSRYTYPGQRVSSAANSTNQTIPSSAAAAAAATRNNVHMPTSSLPSMPPTTAHGMMMSNTTTTTTSSSSYNPASCAPPVVMNHHNTVIRGQPTEPGSRVPPPSTPVSTTTTTTTTTTPGVGSMVDASATSLRPGAYQVTRTTQGPAIVYRVTIPPGIQPGAEFHVHAGVRRVRVRCPPTSRPGQSLQITLPPEPITNQFKLRMSPLTAPMGGGGAGGGAVEMTPEVRQVNAQAEESGGSARSFLVDIPPNIYPGMSFTVNVSGQRFMVTCPPSAGPNMRIRIVPPTVREEPEASPRTQVFEVAVPPNVRSGQPFALVANGQRVLVTCPPNVVPGQKIRFQLPVSQVVGNIQLQYESNVGWRRTIRVTDMKFQWVRLDKELESTAATSSNSSNSNAGAPGAGAAADTPGEQVGAATSPEDVVSSDIDTPTPPAFDFQKSAYVRKLTFLEGNDARMRTGRVELVPASEAVVDSRLVVHNRTLLSYADIAEQQGKSCQEKTDWFQGICTQLTSAWEDGHVKMVLRRPYLLLDSVDAVMSLGRDDLRKRWRIEFLGEPAIDAGGVSREWFQLVTEQLFDPAFGLWVSSINNQMAVNINASSGISCPDDHLVYFRFLGRVLGRALFDRQLVKGHMVRTIYKHLLGWPITFEDIQAQDEEYYNSLKKLTNMDDISIMCLDFTVTEESMGVHTEVELVPDGALKEVTKENLAQYLEANLRYRMMDRTKPQLTELLLGFFDVVPEPALTVFDANELELILCGLPTIDMNDWRANTNYSGLFETKGPSSPVIRWFWDVVTNDFDMEMKARLLQFVTGTSGVPSRGFSVLQGIDGNIKKFTIHGVDSHVYVLPRAHTCFNRIDLPDYASRKELYQHLKTAITMSGVGFGIE